MNTIKIGSFVKSNQGRDRDNIYIVKRIFDKRLELVDGNEKKLSKPKIKNIKHIDVLDGCAEKIAQKFVENKIVHDAEVYSAIRKFENQ